MLKILKEEMKECYEKMKEYRDIIEEYKELIDEYFLYLYYIVINNIDCNNFTFYNFDVEILDDINKRKQIEYDYLNSYFHQDLNEDYIQDLIPEELNEKLKEYFDDIDKYKGYIMNSKKLIKKLKQHIKELEDVI